MSLIKSFNLKFFIENVRKSRGFVIFSLIVNPVITALLLLLGYAGNTRSVMVLDPNSIIGVNIFLLALVPFIYTNILFGFVYKKKSTDFMNSMPLNRKTIYVSNTFGGILLITLMQIIAALVIVICCALSPSLVLIPKVVIYTLGAMWLSYVFVYSANNLAMAFSGNLITQLLISICIVILLPFSFMCTKQLIMAENLDYGRFAVERNDEQKVYSEQLFTYDYTIPYNSIITGFRFEKMITFSSVIKTASLSIVYSVLGWMVYKRKKMENNEEPFGTYEGHLILKTITLIPILLIINLIDASGGDLSLITIIVLLAIYYIVYDFIIRRKVSVIVSTVAFITTVAVLEAGIVGIRLFANCLNEKVLERDDIVSIAIEDNTYDSYFSIWSNYEEEKMIDGKYFIKDKEFVDEVIDSMSSNYDYNYYRYDYSLDYPDDCYFAEDKYDSSEYVKINFKTRYGKVYSGKFYLSRYNYFINKIIKDEEYLEYYKNRIATSGVLTMSEKIASNKLNKVFDKALEETYVEPQKNIDYIYTLKKYCYIDNEMKIYKIPVDLTDKLLETSAKEANENARKILNKSKYENDTFFYADVYLNNKNREYINTGSTYFRKFLENSVNKEFNAKKPYAIIELRYDDELITVFTNDVKELNNYRETSKR